MNKKDVRVIYKQNKKNIKSVYKKELNKIKKQNKVDKRVIEEEMIKSGKIVNPPKRSVLEEIGNAITHGVGAIFSIIAIIFMLKNSNTINEIVGASFYAFGLFTMFTISTLYHSFKNGGKTKRIFRRFDYLCIYLLIGGTFAPILLCYVGGLFGLIFFILQWAIITLGIVFISVFGPSKLRTLHMVFYILLGWCGLLFLPTMIAKNFNFFYFILGGGIIYSLGIIPFALNKKASHFIWHFFVLGGAIIHFIGIFKYIYI